MYETNHILYIDYKIYIQFASIIKHITKWVWNSLENNIKLFANLKTIIIQQQRSISPQ